MPLDVLTPENTSAAQPQKSNPRILRGRLAFLAGQSAETSVLKHYEQAGYVLLEQRWRGKAGEIDLIFEKNGTLIFVEVKSSKTCAQAAENLSKKQLSRICLSAQDYAGRTAKGALSDIRIDAALVDAAGRIEILENVTI